MAEKKLSLVHLTRPPKTATKNPPLLLMLHGYGSDENDLFSFASELPPELFIISVRAPQKMQPYGNAWYEIYWNTTGGKFNDTEQAADSRDLIAKFIDEAVKEYEVNPENVILLGFSQGAILSYATALTYPKKVKNIIALSGYIDREILPEELDPSAYEHLDFYCSHGSMDQMIPVELARKTKPFLDKLGIRNVYSEFTTGHNVAPQNFFELKTWLEERI